MTNRNFCMSSYLAFRFIADESVNFKDGFSHEVFKPKANLTPIKTAKELEKHMAKCMSEELLATPEENAVFLSGGIDSAVVASFMPCGARAYTFKCVADGAIDETAKAKAYADKFGLKHEVIEMHWGDFEELTDEIIADAQVPVHSIEIQLLKAARLAKSQGVKKIFIGESSDLIYGGMDKLLSKDWSFDEFKERYTFTKPENVLKDADLSVYELYEKYKTEGDKIDFLKFMDDVFAVESPTSYLHAFKMANLPYFDPFATTFFDMPLDLARIRNGDPKYLVRELFSMRYDGQVAPAKIPMPRAMNQWMADYKPTRSEFKSGCETNLTGDQKWQLYCLERFLNLFFKEA